MYAAVFMQPNSVSEPPNEMCAYLYAVIQVCSKFQLLLKISI